MPALSFRNRIALYYMITTALLVFVVFVLIYRSVKAAVYHDLEEDIKTEVADLLGEIRTYPGGLAIKEADEWKEKEHNTLNVNPIFIQFVSKSGRLLDKSPNLKASTLTYTPNFSKNTTFYNSHLDSSIVRQIQYPVYYKQQLSGYIMVAVPLGGANGVLDSLEKIMIISYPLILFVLYAIARFLAGRSISPIAAIISTSRQISQENLSSRIPLPQNKDELFVLSTTINELLDRISDAIDREKEFTSNASHELRTPLSVIKGTLEVLIRKPRTPQEYVEKAQFCLAEVNRLTHLTEELLLLARFENQKQTVSIENVDLEALVLDALARHSADMQSNNMGYAVSGLDRVVQSDSYLLTVILDNLISNSVKYAGPGTTISLIAEETSGGTVIIISDNGHGIATEDLEHLYARFFRGSVEKVAGIKGTGLGLSIVKRLCTLLNIGISIESAEGTGTTVTLSFNPLIEQPSNGTS